MYEFSVRRQLLLVFDQLLTAALTPLNSLSSVRKGLVGMSKEEEAPKYQLEDILNKKKPPPQILDLHGIKFVFIE